MAGERNNKDDQMNSDGGNYMEYFKEHNKHMSVFRNAHANVAMVNATRLDDAALIERMEFLQVRRNMTETGGSDRSEDTTDWSSIVHVWKVAQHKLSQN